MTKTCKCGSQNPFFFFVVFVRDNTAIMLFMHENSQLFSHLSVVPISLAGDAEISEPVNLIYIFGLEYGMRSVG